MAATLASVGVRALVPPDADPAAVARMSRALGDPLLAALPSAFDRLERLDPGGFWVLKDLHVHMSLAGIDPDVGAIARAVAEALAEGIATAVAQGPGTEVVRFAGRDAYVAAYAAARTTGISGGWVFAPLRSVDPLPVPDALVAAARALEVPVEKALIAFAEHPSWQRMVDAATIGEADRLVAALRGARPATPAASGAVAPGVTPDELAVLLPTGRRLLGASGVLALLGRAVRAAGPSPHVLDAVLALTLQADDDGGTPGAPEQPPQPRHRTEEPEVAPPVPGRDPDRPQDAGQPAHPPDGVRSPGATVFMLLPDLAELVSGTLLAGPGRPASRLRAGLLRSVVGPSVTPDDPALLLASGADPDDENGEDAEASAVTEADLLADLRRLAASIAADELLARQHRDDPAFVSRGGDSTDPPAVTVAVALLRRFARHLPGFGEAGAAYLIPQVLVPGGRTRVLRGMIEVSLVRPPLGVLLALAGLDAFVASVPWLPVPFTLTHEEPA